MGVSKMSLLVLVNWVIPVFFFKAYGGGSEVSVKFLKAPSSFSSLSSASFAFEILVGGNRDACSNCSVKCQLDDQSPLNCESGEVSYKGMIDGEHVFQVFINVSKLVQSASYNWTVDTVPPTAYVAAERSFTNASSVSVDILFSEPCTGGSGFHCSSVNTCNLLVYGAGQVIPSSLKILQPDVKFSLLVETSSSVQYGRVILVMDKGFCTDAAGNSFTRSANSSFYLHFDKRSVFVNVRTRIPEKFIKLNSQTRTVEATNSIKNVKVFLYFSEPVMNSTSEILRVLHTSNGLILPTNAKSLGNRHFSFRVHNLSNIAIVTITLEASAIISRQGTPVSPMEPVTFLYDSERPSVRLSTSSTTRTRESHLPVLIKFTKPVFGFNSSAVRISGGHLHSFHELSRSIYSLEIRANCDLVYVSVPENVTGDVAGNENLASNILQLRHYSTPLVASVLSTLVTAAFGMTSLASGFLTVSTANLQSLGLLSGQATLLSTDPSRNLFRIACHIQVFSFSKWLAVTLPIEYYELISGLQWSIPHFNLPWETGDINLVMENLIFPAMTHAKNSLSESSRSSKSKSRELEIDALLFGLPLTPSEYISFFESQNTKPEADLILVPQTSNGWKDFNKNMFWLSVIGGGLLLLHALFLSILRSKRDSKKPKNYGALIFPRFEIFLVLLALPCICQASAAIIKGGSALGLVVGILLLGFVSFLLLLLLLFLSIGVTLGKLLQYKEVHQECQSFQWYHDLVRVTLGPGKRGQWSWKNQTSSSYLRMLGPLFEDLRGPPKYMLSQIADGSTGRTGDRIIASDDETEDAEAPFIQKVFGILRIYYTLLESVKRVALGIVAGSYLAAPSSKFPSLFLLCVTSFQLFFLVLKKPFISKKVQLVELIFVSCEVGIFAACNVLFENEFSVEIQRRIGIFMLVLFMLGFSAQMTNEWQALYKQTLSFRPGANSFILGFKEALVGFLLIFVPEKLLKHYSEEVLFNGGSGENGETPSSSDPNQRSESRNTGASDRPWLKQLRATAKASFSRDDSVPGDPSTSQLRKGIGNGKTSGNSSLSSSFDSKSRSKGLYRDLEAIFSSK